MSKSSLVAPRRRKGLWSRVGGLAFLSVVALSAAACGQSSSTSAPASGSAKPVSNVTAKIPTTIPPGTVLKVAQQFGSASLPIQLSGTKLAPNLNIDWSNFTGGPQIVQALEANAIDLGTLGDVPMAYTQVAAKGVVAVLTDVTAGKTYFLMTAPGSSIRSVAQLKGKKVAYTQATAPQGFLLHVLKNAGLSKSDVDLINIQSQSDVNAALESKSVDAAVSVGSLVYQYKQKNPSARILAQSSAPSNTSGYGYWVTTQKALSDPAKVAAIAAFIKAEIAGQLWVNEHPAIWVQKYYEGEEQLSPTLSKQLNDLTGPTTFIPITSKVIDAQQTIINLLSGAGFIPSGLKASAGFDTRFNSVVTAANAAAAAGT